MHTILYETHRALNAKMVDFFGWEMPLHYGSILQEHLNVRQHAAIFDLSHMGIVFIEGQEATDFLDFLCASEIKNKPCGKAIYTVFCLETGTSLEDLILYKETELRFFLVINAANRKKVLSHLSLFASAYRVEIQERYRDMGILSVQGPLASHLLISFFSDLEKLSPMHFIQTKFSGELLYLARTGYTGEKGYEIFTSNALISTLWHTLIEQGKRHKIFPAGLGARDSLRLEMGYALYGHELDETIFPSESVAGWTIAWSKENFLGKKALLELEKKGTKRMEIGAYLKEKKIARAGDLVFKDNQLIGKVTSGAYTPSLKQAIALLLLEKNVREGDSVEIQIRGQKIAAEIVKPPFLKQSK